MACASSAARSVELPRAQLEGHHAAQVVLHRQAIHHEDARVGGGEPQLAAIALAVVLHEAVAARRARHEGPVAPRGRVAALARDAQQGVPPLDAPCLSARAANQRLPPALLVDAPLPLVADTARTGTPPASAIARHAIDAIEPSVQFSRGAHHRGPAARRRHTRRRRTGDPTAAAAHDHHGTDDDGPDAVAVYHSRSATSRDRHGRAERAVESLERLRRSRGRRAPRT